MDNRRPPRHHSLGSKPYGGPRRGPDQRSGQFQSRDGNRDGDREGRRPRPAASDGFRGVGSDTRPFNSRPRTGSYSQQSNGQRGIGGYNKTDRFTPKGRTLQRRGVPAQPQLPPITSDLQITDGKFRGQRLENAPSPNATPTARKLREIMFKVASRRVRAGRFLDLGAGMGMVGMEAISRGAMVGTFVERSAKMCSFIKRNLGTLGIKDGHGEVVEKEVSPFLKSTAKRKRCWDLVFLGTRKEDGDAFGYLQRGVSIARGGLLLIEHPSDQEFPERMGVLTRWRTIANDGSTITFYERK
jgi:16S rRNA (guanine966-N2)-methyltransferase